MIVMGKRPNRMWKKYIGSYYSWKMNVGCGNNMQAKSKEWHGGVPPHLVLPFILATPNVKL
jgi:hypothetical protein